MGVLPVKYFRKVCTVTGAVYAEVLSELKEAIKRNREENWDDGIFLLHDNAPPHTSVVSQTAIKNLGFVQLSHPPYSPNLQLTTTYFQN